LLAQSTASPHHPERSQTTGTLVLLQDPRATGPLGARSAVRTCGQGVRTDLSECGLNNLGHHRPCRSYTPEQSGNAPCFRRCPISCRSVMNRRDSAAGSCSAT
jgi:hypothetical protein